MISGKSIWNWTNIVRKRTKDKQKDSGRPEEERKGRQYEKMGRIAGSYEKGFHKAVL